MSRLIGAKAGLGLIELLVYMALLGVFGQILFSFTYQMRQSQAQVLNAHLELIKLQSALNSLVFDLRTSERVKLTRGITRLNCQCGNGQVAWQLEDGVLKRTLSGGGRARPHTIKVAEGVKELQLQQTNYPKYKTSLVQVQLTGSKPQLKIQRQVLRTVGMVV